jgi:hypothetical protein
MRTVTDAPVLGSLSLIESHRGSDAPARSATRTSPTGAATTAARRPSGDPVRPPRYVEGAKKQARLEQTTEKKD